MEVLRIAKALANGRRLEMLRLLTTEELPVTEIASRMKLSVKATSKHLLLLYRADILGRRQESLTIFYRIASPQHPLIATLLAIP